MTRRLSVGELQIWIDEQGTAKFSDTAHKRDRVAVEAKLTEYRDFVERWLEVSEETRPRRIGEEEREFRAILRRFGQILANSGFFETDFIKAVIQEVAKNVAQPLSSSLSPTQISESVDDVISTL